MLIFFQLAIILIINILGYYSGGIISSMAKLELIQFKKYIQFMLVFLQIVAFIIMFQNYVIYAAILSAAAILFWYLKKTFSTTLAIAAITLAAGTNDARAIAFVVLLVQGVNDYELIMADKNKTKSKMQSKNQSIFTKQEKGFSSKILTIKKYTPRALIFLVFSAVFFVLFYLIVQ